MDKIEELLTRGVEKIYPSKEELEKVLRSGKKLKLYQGFDPTGTQLHIGHMVGLIKLKQWQDLGHHVIFLIGDFTAMVGDPSGRYSARKPLTHEQTFKNAKGYKAQASKILDFDGKNPVEVLFNGNWLGKLSAIEFFKIAGLLSVQQVIERDIFQERQKKGQDVFINEFLYPVMQAYDSVAMNVDLEIGGSDQMFNMLMGRKLMRHMLKKDKFVMTTSLLADSQGNKIGKTEGNVIALTDNSSDLFSKVMSFPDEVIVKCFECLTTVPMKEIINIKDQLKKGGNPMGFKKRLAFEIVKQLNTEKEASKAQKYFEEVVQKKRTPSHVPEQVFPRSFISNATIIDALEKSKIVSSRSEAKRVISQGGTAVYDTKVTDPNLPIAPLMRNDEMIIKVGKRKIVKIKVNL